MRKLLHILLFLLISIGYSYAQCLSGGTLLFKEDFGGNDPEAPVFTTTPLQDSLVDHEYIKFNNDGNPMRTRWVTTNYGSYAVRKYAFDLHQQWWGYHYL